MCECAQAAAAADQVLTETAARDRFSDDPEHWGAKGRWTSVCPAVLRTVKVGRTQAVRRCGLEAQGGVAGLHAHWLTVHPDLPWTPRPGHP